MLHSSVKLYIIVSDESSASCHSTCLFQRILIHNIFKKLIYKFKLHWLDRWIPRLIAQLEKKLFGIPDFFIAFGSSIDANIMDIFGFGRDSPHWPQRTVKFLLFFKICWRWTTLKDHISESGWPIWARVCLLERLNSLLLGKNMKFGIYRLSLILGQWQCSMSYNSGRPSSSEASLRGL
jgi:hypothetical protein